MEERTQRDRDLSAAVAFEAAASGFCRILEDAAFDRAELLRRLLDLTRLALDLPAIEPTMIEVPDPADLDESCRQVRIVLGDVLGSVDGYWTALGEANEEPALGFGSLTDDIGDTYRDLRRGLHAAAMGLDDAVWEWKFSFIHHWGNHATDAIRTLHRIVNDPS